MMPNNTPPAMRPMMLATAPALAEKPCTVPWYRSPAATESRLVSEGHISPFPNAKSTSAG